jgi:pyridoxamine 5'-phosphate oxidase
MNNDSLAAMRENYTLGGLSEADAGIDPVALFKTWFSAVITAKLPEPNAMILSTVSAERKPSSRAVLLKQFDEQGLTFFTNYESRKGDELLQNPHASLLFLWLQLERQIRIEGKVEKVSAKESDDYFAVRPLGSKLGAWASRQSDVIPDRAFMEKAHEELKARYPDGQVPRPEFWGGYRLVPEVFEFWQGRQSRLHDRLRFTKIGKNWKRERLSP